MIEMDNEIRMDLAFLHHDAAIIECILKCYQRVHGINYGRHLFSIGSLADSATHRG